MGCRPVNAVRTRVQHSHDPVSTPNGRLAMPDAEAGGASPATSIRARSWISRDERQYSRPPDVDRRGRLLFLTLTNVGMITARFVQAAHGSLRLRMRRRSTTAFRTLRCDQHRRHLHVLLPGAGCGDLFLALPHHAAGTLADGHGRTVVCPAAARSSFRQSLQRPLKPTG